MPRTNPFDDRFHHLILREHRRVDDLRVGGHGERPDGPTGIAMVGETICRRTSL